MSETDRLSAGWVRFCRTVERVRRERRGEPMIQLAGAGESRCAERPGGRSPRPATVIPERGEDGGGRRR